MTRRLNSVVAAVAVSVGFALTPVASSQAQTYPPFPDPVFIPDALDHLKCYPMQILNPPNPYELPEFPVALLNQWQVERQCFIQVPPRFFCSESMKFRYDVPPGVNQFDDPRGRRSGDFVCYDVVCDPAANEPTIQVDGTPTPPRGQFEDQFTGAIVQFKINNRRPRLVCAPVIKRRPEPPIGFPPNEQ